MATAPTIDQLKREFEGRFLDDLGLAMSRAAHA